MFTAVDLFAGCGGTSEGARQAGIKVLVSANHWPAAVETHRANHPGVEHYLQDLQQADFHAWPDFDILMASPACQGHSVARGKEQPRHDVTRSTAWAVIACAEAKLPRAVIIENVPEYLRWRLYPQWKACLETLGYTVSETILDAADLGVPQHRRRVFIVGVRQASPVVIPPGNVDHVNAETIIDDDAASWSPIQRDGRSVKTLLRINAGRALGERRFLIPFYGSGSGTTGRSLKRPLGTVTTKARYALVDGDWMRMLTVNEYRKAMAFPDGFVLPRTQSLAIHLLGNAVPPPMAKHVLQHVQACL